MAKSKKKNHKPKKKQKQANISQTLKLIPLEMFMVMPYIANLKPYRGGRVSPSLILNGITERRYLTQDNIRDLEEMFHGALYPLLMNAMASPHLDQSMNVYIDDADAPNKPYNMRTITARRDFRDKCDMLDFTHYKPGYSDGDVFLDAFNRTLRSDDPSFLWSTKDMVSIRVNDTTEYLIKRGSYDKQDKTIEYEVRAIESVYLMDKRLLKVPSLIVKGKILMLPVASIEKTLNMIYELYFINNQPTEEGNAIDLRYTICTINKGIVKNLKESLTEEYDDIDWNWNEIYLPVFETSEILYGAHISAYCRKQITPHNIPKTFLNGATELAQKSVSTAISNLLLGLFRDEDNVTMITDEDDCVRPSSRESTYNITAHMLQKTMLPFACIIVANGLIADKKMSRAASAKKSSKTRIYEIAEHDAENAGDHRKTRILADSIRISSAEKPDAPTLKKIIRYSMFEWERAGHFRHYKSGKVVEIKPAVIHRRCVNLDKKPNTDTNLGTNYIVKNKRD